MVHAVSRPHTQRNFFIEFIGVFFMAILHKNGEVESCAQTPGPAALTFAAKGMIAGFRRQRRRGRRSACCWPVAAGFGAVPDTPHGSLVAFDTGAEEKLLRRLDVIGC